MLMTLSESNLLSSSEGDMNLCHMLPLIMLKDCEEELVTFLELVALGIQGKQIWLLLSNDCMHCLIFNEKKSIS